MLRADIDALPILEKNTVAYASKNEGVIHACGLDAHTAYLLLCAKILFELKDDLENSITLLFQPGEEVMPGGASLVMKEKIPLVSTCWAWAILKRGLFRAFIPQRSTLTNPPWKSAVGLWLGWPLTASIQPEVNLRMKKCFE